MIKFECHHCNFSTISATKFLEHHERVHALLNNLEIVCAVCSKVFSNINSYRVHVSRYHKESTEKNAGSTWSCQYCKIDLEFGEIQRHLKSHLSKDTSEVNCTICGWKMKSSGNLAVHFSRHHKTSPVEKHAREYTAAADFEPDILSSDETHHEENSSTNEALIDVQETFGHFLLKLKSEHACTDKTINFIVSQTKSLVEVLCESIQNAVKGTHYETLIEKVARSLDLDKFKTTHKRQKFFKEKFMYVSPTEHDIGLDKFGAKVSVQYVSIEDNLKSLFKDDKVWSLVNEFRPQESDEDMISDFSSGYLFKKNEQQMDDNTLRIHLILFDDGLNLCNPIGNSNKSHNEHGVYYSIGNLPPHLRNKSDNIQSVMMYSDQLLKRTSQAQVFSPMIRELLKLRTIGMEFKGKNIQVFLFCCCADNKGAHQLGGFAECFSKGYICRWCLINSKTLAEGDISIKELRNENNHLQFLSSEIEIDHGVKSNSPFNELQNFHATKNLAFDSAHDTLHGAFSSDLHIIINHYVREKVFSLQNLNGEIEKLAQEGKISIAHFTNDSAVKGKMSEVYNLIIFLPVILKKMEVNFRTSVWKLLIQMVSIMRLVTAEQLSYAQVNKMHHHIESFFQIRKNVFKDARLLPKHHYLKHYSALTFWFGPPKKFWTLPFEKKHQFFKFHSNHAKNFKNVEKMLLTRHQMFQASLHGDRIGRELKFAALLDNQEDNNDFIYFTRNVCYKSVEFKLRDNVLAPGSNDDEIFLLEITKILVSSDSKRCKLVGKMKKLIFKEELGYFEGIFQPIETQISSIEISEIVHHKPLKIFKVSNSLVCSPKQAFFSSEE
jgi:hypothetical protein